MTGHGIHGIHRIQTVTVTFFCDMMAMHSAEDGALKKRCVRLKGRLRVT
jgi:hypothetical protein